MDPVWRLSIGLTRDDNAAPTPGLGLVQGGRSTLLKWLEERLGLPHPHRGALERVVAWSVHVAATQGESFRASFQVDPWATAVALLQRRDGLRLAGWDESDRDTDPPFLRDLARVAAQGPIPPGEPERIAAVTRALETQRLPACTVRLDDPMAAWPALWRPLLATVGATEAGPATACGEGALRAGQEAALGPAQAATPDGHVAWLEASSRLAACRFVAAAFAADPAAAAATTVVADEDTAVLLDAVCEAAGVPAGGAWRATAAEPTLAVLPLVVELLWEPADAADLLAFLLLPVSPVRRAARARLSRALAQQPGLGSAAWEAAVVDLARRDDGAEVVANVKQWLDGPRTPRGEPVPQADLHAALTRVVRWAQGRAATLAEAAPAARALRTLAGQAAALQELTSADASWTQARLGRLVDAVRGGGERRELVGAKAGGFTVARSLVDVPPGTKRLVWFGLAADPDTRADWSPAEAAGLAQANLDVDDTATVAAGASAAARGFARVEETALFVSLPADLDAPPDATWSAIKECLWLDAAPQRMDAMTKGAAGWQVTGALARHATARTSPTEWTVRTDAGVPTRPVSASALMDLAVCPLRWTLRYRANLRPSPVAELPSGRQLRGTFVHDVLRRVFVDGVPLPPDEAASRATTIAQERLPLDAPPLLAPDGAHGRGSVVDVAARSARRLAEVLAAGGYTKVAVEQPFEATVDGVHLHGQRDCVATTDDGDVAVIDFKLSGVTRHRDLLNEDRHIQLAVYAAPEDRDVGAAILALEDSVVLTPRSDPIRGVPQAEHAGTRAEHDLAWTWQRAVQAYETVKAAAAGAEAKIPIYPRQDPQTWPAHVAWAFDPKKPEKACDYCDYRRLCGRDEVA